MSSWESKEERGVGGWTETLAMGCEERKVSLPVSFRRRDREPKEECVCIKAVSGLGTQEWQLACTVQCPSSGHEWNVLWARQRQEAPAWSPERK